MYRLIAIFLSFLLTSIPSTAESDDEGYFDYRETHVIGVYIQGAERGFFVGNPFESNTGARFYQATLPYISQLEEITMPLPDPLYYFDYHSTNSMKRFSVGQGWIATENQVAFIRIPT